jgi:penicillin amidase
MNTRKTLMIGWAIVLAAFCLSYQDSKSQETIVIEGLDQSVEIIKDRWGIAHIYAQTQDDLFFAQGFNVASDRLFQLEVWRRQATGTMSEILGPKALKRDIGARLLKYRGDLRDEMGFYHPQGERIIAAFVRGINAYIGLTRRNPDLLPLEFRLLGLTPSDWTPEVVISRHNGLFRNVSDEVTLSRAVRLMGPEKPERLLDLHPGNPDLRPPKGLELALISGQILELYRESRSPVRFDSEDIVDPAARAVAAKPEKATRAQLFRFLTPPPLLEGSNNWAVSGRLTQNGYPLLANDPHRSIQVPSLRYWVHLNAPEWNVIGGGEPALPGVSIGHNDSGAWGLTIFAADQEDLYVYETNPANPNQYKYRGQWEDMKIVREKIPVKGHPPHEAALRFTRHGPVVFEDIAIYRAFALRAAWLETGCAPYLSSLRMDQARTWEEFRQACFRNRAPSENMIWADRDGHIGWQATGLVPLRENWPGLLPIPGDGRYEWAGFIPAPHLPSLHDPDSGYVATANQDNLPPGYPYPVGYVWAEPFRIQRITEFLTSREKMGISDMQELQQDVFSIPARLLVLLLKDLRSDRADVQKCLELLRSWDYRLSPESGAAAVYVAWQRRLSDNLNRLLFPGELQRSIPGRSLLGAIRRIQSPGDLFERDPARARDKLLLESLGEAADFLTQTFGPDISRWRYGDEKFHRVEIRHPLSAAVKGDLRRRLDVGPLPRGGNGETVNNTSGSNNQASGATFRLIVDLSDWDLAQGTNSPGQSGDPDDSHYSDLFSGWAEGRYFPVCYSRSRVESAAEKTITLKPPSK